MAKRQAFKLEFKARLVLEELTGVKTAADICREHKLKPQIFSRWKAELPENNTWRRMVRQRVEIIDWSQVLRDVQPFLETQVQMGLLTPLNLQRLLAPDGQK